MHQACHSNAHDPSVDSAAETGRQYPLSSSQMAVWLEQAIYPDLPSSNIGGYGEIGGPLDPELFQFALRNVVRQSDALRMVFSQDNGMPTPRCLDDVDYEVPFMNFLNAGNPEEASLTCVQPRFVDQYPPRVQALSQHLRPALDRV